MALNTTGALSGAVAGATVGSAIPVVGTAVGALVGGAIGLLGSPSSAQPGGAGGGPFAMPQSTSAASPQSTSASSPLASQAAAFGSGIDGSGWIINFGSGNTNDLNNAQDKTIRSTGPTATGTADSKAEGKAESASDAKAGISSPYSPYMDAYGYGSGAGGLGLETVPMYVWYLVFGAVAWRLYKSKK